jgi:hypothetical protein
MPIRNRITAATFAVMTGVALLAAPAVAHHSSVPFYDSSQSVELEGTVSKFIFRNPHAFLYLNVTEANGSMAEWQVELGAPVSLQRTGWTPDTLPVGMVVKVTGPPARGDGAKGVLGRRMTRADGSPIVDGGRVEEVTPPR